MTVMRLSHMCLVSQASVTGRLVFTPTYSYELAKSRQYSTVPYSNAGTHRHVLPKKKSEANTRNHVNASRVVIVAVMSNLQCWMRMATKGCGPHT